MAYNLKQEAAKPERFSGGHRLCAGCGAAVAVRGVMRALDADDKAVVGCATGCLEVSSFLYPYTAWRDSFIQTRGKGLDGGAMLYCRHIAAL